MACPPDGLSTQLGTELGGIDLSEGQWQRTVLARASMRIGSLLFVLDEGRIIEAGTHQELMHNGGQYAELYRIQLDAYSVG